MAKQGNTPAVPAPAPAPAKNVCAVCGKTLTKSTSVANGQGHKCANLIAQGYTGAKLQAHYATVTGQVPAGYITVASLHRTITAQKANVPGLTVAKMVKAIGGDRALNAPAHPIAKPVYNGQRWVHPWLATAAGLQAIATGNWGKAPAK